MSNIPSECECSEEARNVKADLEGRIRGLEGRMRGLEAALAEILTPENSTAARHRIREMARRRDKWCEISELLNQPLDRHAEAELDTLDRMVENRQA